MAPNKSRSPGPDPVAQRLRQRRQALGLSLQRLAQLVGIRAASHIHHIENGEKIPSEELALRLGQALGDEPALYRAWVRARQRGDLEVAQEAVRELDRLLGPPGMATGLALTELLALGRSTGSAPPLSLSMMAAVIPSQPSESLLALPTARELDSRWLLEGEAHATAAPAASPEAVHATRTNQAPPLLLRIPILPESADPDLPGGPATAAHEVLRLDPRALPTPEDLVRPFAYRLTHSGARHAPHALRAGDLVIVTRNAWPLHPDPAYAVRLAERIVLTRARWKNESLWMHLDGEEGEREVPGSSGTPPSALVGRVAAVFRAAP